MHIDMTKYTLVPHVPVLDESTIFYNDGEGKSQPFPVTPEFLARCAKNMNAKEKTGSLCVLGLGKHTDPDANPQDQPPVVGLARNWVVGDWVDGKKALYVDYLVNNHDVDAVRRYPRRSAEVWLSRAEIDPISLLGTTTPERDLGLVLLNRQPDLKVSYLSREQDSTMEPNATAVADAAKSETGEAKGIEALVGAVKQLIELMTAQATAGAGAPAPAGPVDAAAPAPGAPATGAPGEGDMSDEELEQLLAQLESEHKGGEETPAAPEPTTPKKDEPVSQNSSAPGGSNTCSPEVIKLQREVAILRDQTLRHEYEAKLNALTVEVPSDELNYVMALPPAYRDAHIERIAKCNKSKAPINNGIEAIKQSVTGDPVATTARTAEDVAKCRKYCKENPGTSYEVALDKLFGVALK